MLQTKTLTEVPQLERRQDSLDDQLKDLSWVALRMGMCDAADWLNGLRGHRDRWKPNNPRNPWVES